MKFFLLILSLFFATLSYSQFPIHSVAELQSALNGGRDIRFSAYWDKIAGVGQPQEGIRLQDLLDAIIAELPPGSSGTVESIDITDLAPLFTATESGLADITVTLALSNAANNTVFGNVSGGAAPPVFYNPDLASGLFANEGTTATVWHGNASGNGSFAPIVTGDITNGTLLEEDYAAQSVTSNIIANATIANGDMANNSIASANIIANTIDGTDIGDFGGDAITGDIMTFNGTDWVASISSHSIFDTEFVLDEDFIGGGVYDWQGVLVAGVDEYEQHPGIGGYTATAAAGGVSYAYLLSNDMRLYPDEHLKISVYAHETFLTANDSFSVGFGGTGSSDAIFFIFEPNQNIRFMAIKDGVQSSINTGVQFAIDGGTGSAWTAVEFIVNGAATSVEAFIDGVSVGTLSANLPTGVADFMRPELRSWAGSGDYELEFDYWKVLVPNLTR